MWLLLCLLFLVPLSSCNQATTSGAGAGATGGKKSSQAPATYVAIGASDTFGVGADDPYTQNWPTDLVDLLGNNVHLINLGIPGMTLHNALHAELPIALDSHPNLVTIWLAVNDLATNVPVTGYARDLDYLLTQVQSHAPHVRIAVVNVPDLTELPYFAAYDQQTLRQQMSLYNQVIANIVQGHHAVLVDLRQYDLKDFPEYISSDGLHPSTSGYLRLSQIVYTALRQAGR